MPAILMMFLQAGLQRFLAMHGNGNFFDVAGFAVDVVTAIHPEK
jgi:hypothetical protein